MAGLVGAGLQEYLVGCKLVFDRCFMYRSILGTPAGVLLQQGVRARHVPPTRGEPAHECSIFSGCFADCCQCGCQLCIPTYEGVQLLYKALVRCRNRLDALLVNQWLCTATAQLQSKTAVQRIKCPRQVPSR